MREEHKLRVMENCGLKRTFGSEKEEVTADSPKLISRSYMIYNPRQICKIYYAPSIHNIHQTRCNNYN